MELTLPDSLAYCLSKIVDKLDTLIERHTYQLGGGTVLAARWNHRYSTDLDLFFTGYSTPAILTDIYTAFQNEAEFSPTGFYPSDGFDGHYMGVPFSFVKTIDVSKDRVSKDTAYGIGTESSIEILSKKIRGRIINRSTFVIRDMYDLSVALYKEPDMLKHAFETIPQEGRDVLAFDSDDFLINRSKPLLNAKYQALTSSVVLRDIVQHMMRYDFEKAQTQIDRALGANEG